MREQTTQRKLNEQGQSATNEGPLVSMAVNDQNGANEPAAQINKI